MQHRLSTLTTACVAALISTGAFADQGSFVGKLSDSAKQVYFEGAQVRLKELNLTTTTRRDGSFRFTNLDAGTYTLEISYLGTAPVTKTITIAENQTRTGEFTLSDNRSPIEDVVVYGQRAGQAGALNMQRSADSIKSIVSSDAIGQFPDQNVAEALQRLPGLSIERDQGEGRFVGIRGLDPNLNNVTVNGVNIPSPEAGVRSVALDVFPSELVEGLEVSKTVTPDMDADAIGGSIEVKSLSAFDRAGQSASLTVQGSQNQLRDQTSPKVSASYTNRYDLAGKQDVLGIATAVSWFDRDFGSDNIETNGEDELEQRHYTVNRERLGAALNLDYRPDFNNQYYLRTLYSEFSDTEFRQANIFVFDGEDSEVERESKDRFEEQQIFSVTAGAEHQLDQWLLTYQAGYSESSEDEPDALYYVFKTDGFAINSDLLDQIPYVEQEAGVSQLSNYELDEIEFASNQAEDQEYSIKVDIARDLTFSGHAAQIKFGSKYRNREKQQNTNVTFFDGDFDDIDPGMFADETPDWGLGDFGQGLDKAALRSYFNTSRSGFEIAKLDSEIESNGESFVNEEDIFAAYLMGKIDMDNLRIVAGLRYEKTDFSTSGQRVELIEDELNDIEQVVNTPWIAEQNYDYLLPSLNMRYAISDNMLARFAYTQTVARPKFEESAAFQIIESKTEENDEGGFDTEREAEVGNPELKPFESDNIDLTLEYYPGGIGVLSAGYFYKDISNFVIFADVADLPEWDGFDEVVQPINGEDAKLQGIELAWVKTFDSGLLLAANATFSDSEAVTLLDGERFETSLPNQSDRVGNFTLGYEDNHWSLRLTMTHKSENLEEVDGDMLLMEDSHQQLDFSGKYYISEDMHLYLNAINITDEPFYAYFNQRSRNAQYEEYGRTFELGFTWKM
ncbi:TonB-dependent receptor [Lacimicrobium alkaliphilum]|uniref:TonB-dependent receptor n=1 Tax=Lacimicrobium alkaliphilum TaxID=1526571 RepID=A0ABQ1REX2_9ALTE|nr:TonB-dependent receptor [Lacimicrobium alkaliphilum]GGD66102.1 TonB-dependent receptor [Lacimicrobium alkaliphilum]